VEVKVGHLGGRDDLRVHGARVAGRGVVEPLAGAGQLDGHQAAFGRRQRVSPAGTGRGGHRFPPGVSVLSSTTARAATFSAHGSAASLSARRMSTGSCLSNVTVTSRSCRPQTWQVSVIASLSGCRWARAGSDGADVGAVLLP